MLTVIRLFTDMNISRPNIRASPNMYMYFADMNISNIRASPYMYMRNGYYKQLTNNLTLNN